VHKIEPLDATPESAINCANCVLFPEPVSPIKTITCGRSQKRKTKHLSTPTSYKDILINLF
jgi:hypothetical protein